MTLFLSRWLILVTLGLFGSAVHAATVYRLTIASTEVDRVVTTGSFALPADAPRLAQLRDVTGRILPVQIDDRRIARFIIPRQSAGESLSYVLTDGQAATESVTVSRARADLGVNVAGRRTIVYQIDKEVLPRADIDPRFKRAAYLHPIVSPTGAIVTGDYPSNHLHHHGIWTSWSKARFQGRATNFWEMAEQKGTTEFVALERTWNGPVHGGFVARQQLVDLSTPKPTTALDERWEVTSYNVSGVTPAARIFDLVITQACATADPVTLPKHLYGGLGFRGRDEWDGKDNLIVLTSEGMTTRDAANTSRVRWCYIGGAVESGAVAGIAILSHPENFRAPEHIRVHPEMPFVSFAPVQSGDMIIEPGKPFVARYRFVVFDGPPDRARLETFWNGYARPAVLTLEPRSR